MKKDKKSRFVVQEHFSRTHHFDFRLELDNVLKSWAVPKGLPEKTGIMRLAVQTEDHDLDYINFEGEIPEGFYGAGKVKIFDSGSFELVERTQDKIVFVLNGKKLRGKYTLLRASYKNSDNKNWLVIKNKVSSKQ
ncbi:MAG: DNA polymerase ligase N-terminal domain-containing protein [Candidatus Woesearchaeota archaeon]